MFDDTALIRLVIEDLAIAHNWSYETTLEKFYHSNTCKGISDVETGMFTYAPREIIELFENE
jgi:carbamoylphosphate synthase small subunit